MSPLDIPLLHRADLLAQGTDHHGLDRRLRAGTLARVRPGIYIDPRRAASFRPEEWIIVRARALARACSRPTVFSHQTAAALHGLPVLHPGERVHITLDERRRGSVAGAVRHRGELSTDDVVSRCGLHTTSLARTVADIARTAPFDEAVCALDGALRQVAVRAIGSYDETAAGAFTAESLALVERSSYGRARARRAIAFADGRAQLPGESISRIRLHELGFRAVRLQVAVTGPSASTYFVDFGIDEAKVWGEFDGRTKYLDDEMRAGRSTADVLLTEKRREDWIRGVTGRPVVRWGWADLRDAATLGARLSSFHVALP